PYDAGFVLVRDGVLHRSAFASSAAYLRREGRGLATGPPWPCDFGPDLSRGFRALKTWFTLKVYGVGAPSTAVIGGRLAIRAAIVNHRTGRGEIDALVEKTVVLGRAIQAGVAK